MNQTHGAKTVKTVLTNTSILVVDRLVRYGIGFFVGAAIARYLGPEQYGVLSFVLALVAILMPVMGVGFDSIIIRDISRNPDRVNEVLGSAFLLRLVTGVVMLGIALSLCMYLRPHDRSTLVLVAVQETATLFLCFDVIEVWFQTRLIAKYPVYAKGLAFLLVCVVKVLLIYAGASVDAFIWSGFAEAGFGAVGLVIFFNRQGYKVSRFRFRKSVTLDFIQDGWTLVLAGIATVVAIRADQLLIASFLGDVSLGIYSAAFRFSEFAYTVPAIISVSVLPVLVQSQTEGESRYKGRLTNFMTSMLYLGVLVSLLFSMSSGFIIPRLFGIAFESSAKVLSIQIWAAVLMFLTVASNQHLIVVRRTDIILVRTVCSMLTNLGLNLWVIPRYGLLGAAGVGILSNAVGLASIAFYPTQHYHLREIASSFNPMRMRFALQQLLTSFTHFSKYHDT